MRMFSHQDRCNSFVNNFRLILCQFVGLQNSPVCHAQTNLTALHNFPFRNRFENLQLCCSLIWIPRDFPRYPVAALNFSLTSLSNVPQFQKSNRNNMRARICLELLTPWARCRITYLQYHPLRVPLPSLYKHNKMTFIW